ncbi:hypothetical protein BDN72DRAFT_795188, partial [Pluteus cervinus]
MVDSSIPRALFEILAGYAALVPPSSIGYPKQISPLQIHDFCLQYILLNPHFQQYPPSKQYQRSFWKWIVQNLEKTLVDEDAEIDPRIYDYYLSLMPSSGPALGPPQPHILPQLCPGGLPKLGPPSESYLTYFWATQSESSEFTNNEVILSKCRTATLRESRTLIEGGTTGLRTWLASFVLAQYLIDHPGLLLGKTTLELGSGVGFLGIVISSLQALSDSNLSLPNSRIWLTDVNETVLKRCSDNIKLPSNLSSTHPNIHHQLLDWSAALDPSIRPGLSSFLSTDVNPDLILGADIVFDPNLIPSLIATIHLALTSTSTHTTSSPPHSY